MADIIINSEIMPPSKSTGDHVLGRVELCPGLNCKTADISLHRNTEGIKKRKKERKEQGPIIVTDQK